jgi:hypothetical protein
MALARKAGSVAEVIYHAMCKRGGEFVGEMSVVAKEGRRVTVSERASPVRECNGCEVAEEGKLMIKVTNEAKHGSRVIEARDGWEVETMEVKRHAEELGIEGKGKTDLVRDTPVKGGGIGAKQWLEGKAGSDFGDHRRRIRSKRDLGQEVSQP